MQPMAAFVSLACGGLFFDNHKPGAASVWSELIGRCAVLKRFVNKLCPSDRCGEATITNTSHPLHPRMPECLNA